MYDTSGVYEEEDIKGTAGPVGGGPWATDGKMGWGEEGPVEDACGTSVQGDAAVTVKPHSAKSAKSCWGGGVNCPDG
jgi:hypothetical protein